MKISSGFTLLVFSAILCIVATVNSHARSDKDISGTWLVNETETETLQNKVQRSNRSNRNVAGSVIGIPEAAQVSPNATLKFPIVLECEEISFEITEDKIKASCETGVSRDFLLGKLHGRVTRFRKNVLTESYSSTSRSVKHDIRVDKHGNLIAEVKIKPKYGVSQTYVRVYSRPADLIESEAEPTTEDVQDGTQ